MARQQKLSGISVHDLQRELVTRERRVRSLVKKHARLVKQAHEVAAEIEQLGGSLGGSGMAGDRKRLANRMTLGDTLAKVLAGKELSVGEAIEAVKKTGYRTTSKNFRVQVNIMLAKDPRFKRVGRGQYTVK